MTLVRVACALTLLAALAACSSPDGESQGNAAAASSDPTAPANIKLRLGPAVWSDFQAYLKGIDKTKHGAFAIAEDGAAASGSAICDAAACTDTQQVQAEAVSNCESKGATCTLFAIDRVTQVPYRTPE